MHLRRAASGILCSGRQRYSVARGRNTAWREPGRGLETPQPGAEEAVGKHWLVVPMVRHRDSWEDRLSRHLAQGMFAPWAACSWDISRHSSGHLPGA